MRWSSSWRQARDRRRQSATVGAREVGRVASACAIAASGKPMRCATRITATRRNTARA
ncbi:Uncharacterised protein [Bordetella pertussis]|nr:Uncharacterised protein [Bordetella pertussis]